VQLLPGLGFAEVVGFQKETYHHTFIIPHEQTACSLIPSFPSSVSKPAQRG
jgi:hypothetical protein